jgi:hypothetical protein
MGDVHDLSFEELRDTGVGRLSEAERGERKGARNERGKGANALASGRRGDAATNAITHE